VVEVRIVFATVLAAAADAVLVAHHLQNMALIWLPHWPICMCAISREDVALRREASGRNGRGGGDAAAAGDKQLGICAPGKGKYTVLFVQYKVNQQAAGFTLMFARAEFPVPLRDASCRT
jgi:hypothetical protein